MNEDMEILTIYVFGSSKGETIVLGLPNGQWGVVDCYSSTLTRPETNPAYRLLTKKHVTELAFLCLTHPHEDHFRGMSQLLKSLQIRRFWSFCGLDPDDFRVLKTYFRAEAKHLDRCQLEEQATELAAILDQVEKSGLTPECVHSRRQLYPLPFDPDAKFQIWGLAPSDGQAINYRKSLLRRFTKDDDFRGALPEAHHNTVSAALMLIYGKTRIILGGDVEEQAWEDTVADYGASFLAADVVKISHHGSTNGYCNNLWAHFAKGGMPIAVLTPYNRFGLPDAAAIEHIRNHTTSIHSASRLKSVQSVQNLRLRAISKLRVRAATSAEEERVGCCTIVADNQGQCHVTYEDSAMQM